MYNTKLNLSFQGFLMKKTVLLLVILGLTASADFFNSEAKAEKKAQIENSRLCKMFTGKALEYEKGMRTDELAKITLESYQKRAKIFCTEDKPKAVVTPSKIETVTKETVTEKKVPTVKKIVLHTTKKQIAQEDERLCKIFQDKVVAYKKNMRSDSLAQITLESYEKRAGVFCSSKPLEHKEKAVHNEDKRLCTVFNEGPRLCKIFNKKIVEYEKVMRDDDLAAATLASYKKRASVFCSPKTLKEKDHKVYTEHTRLCEVFQNKVIDYQKDMRNDKLAMATLDSYKKRAQYFCGIKEETNKAKK